MRQQLHIVTLGVPDLAAARRFYVDGLGWEPAAEVPGDIVFLQAGHGLALALWDAEKLERDIAPDAPGPVSAAPAPITLAHNVDTDEAVLEVLARAERAGGTVLKPAQVGEVGFLHGYFADPAGFRWEVAHNPGWRIDPDGRLIVATSEAG